MKILDYLSEKGVDFEVRHHPANFTAQREAAAQHISGHTFAKTVVVKAEQEYVMLVLPATYRVDLERMEALLGVEPEFAGEEELGNLFPDCEVGAEPPFGSQYGLRTLVDEHLAKQERIAVRAGSHREVVLLAYADFARLERPRVAYFGDAEV